MSVNPKKTQLLCTNTAINSDIRSFIYHKGERIESGDTLTTVGFVFGRRAGAGEHVKMLRKKFGARSGMLRHLKKLRLEPAVLVDIYRTFIRPIFEYASCAFHTILTADQSASLERLQRISLKIIFGLKTSYSECLDLSGLERLDIRREAALQKFTQKVYSNERFRCAWFAAAADPSYDLRRKREVIEKFANRDRLLNAPLYRMRRIINQGH